MDLTPTSPIPAAALPLAAFRDHLRLSSGFADDTTQDSLLAGYLRAAIAAVEARSGRALIARDFTLRLHRWARPDAQPLPVAPVAAVTSLTLHARSGSPRTAAPDSYALQPDGARPRLVATGAALPTIPPGGQATVALQAGFGPGWDDVPADLAQAVVLLAAQHYEHRDAGATPAPDAGVRALLARWRDLRLGGGRA